MSDDLMSVEMSQPMCIMRTKDIKHLCDRVEELEAKLKTSEEIGRAFEEDAGQLRAKLAKAVETLKRYGGVMPIAFTPIQDGGYKARTTLAELTGGKDE